MGRDAAPGSVRAEGIRSGAGDGDGRLADFEVLPVHLVENDGVPGGVTLFRGDVVLARPAAEAQLFNKIQIDLDHTHGTFLPQSRNGGERPPEGGGKKNYTGRSRNGKQNLHTIGKD